MFVRECMHKDVMSVTGDASTSEADRLMNDHSLPYLLVVDDGRAVGVVTRDAVRDNVMRSPEPMSANQGIAVLTRRKARDVMQNVITVEPDTPIEYAMILGQEHGISVFPVVEDHHLVGVATVTDFLKRASEAYGYDESNKQFHLLISCEISSMANIFEIVKRSEATLLLIYHSKSPVNGKEHCIVHIGVENAEQIADKIMQKTST